MTAREYNAARIRAARERGDCIQCCKRPALHGVRCDACLAYHREYRKRRYVSTRLPQCCADDPTGYTPLDVTLARPRWRLLRALKRFDWCELPDLFVAAEVADHEKQACWIAAGRLVETGEAECRKAPMRSVYAKRISHATYYRITDKGRAALASLLDGYQRALAA